MPRTTIDFGIDLGTTNSAVAVANAGEIVIIKNNDSMDYTPSAIWVNRNSHLYVGRAAKEHLDDDPENAVAEFKLKMGFDFAHHFPNNGQSMKPEELSAEVLKSLRSDIRQRLNEEITAAVITIPAAFDVDQREATQRAAQLAGFEISPLLQEPVAAALSYSSHHEKEQAYWLVYDFGGGTFDAAVIRLQDGSISVVNHSGDNYLGGKLIDWSIVEELFIPHLLRQASLTDFRRGNPNWRAAIAKLKQDAENAKIRLSHEESIIIMRDFLCVDDNKAPIGFEFELRRSDLEKLAEPFIIRTINTCRKALHEKSLRPADIQKMVLVGGPTLMPYLRERIADPENGLGIPLEFRIDPLTVVAQGAAQFASTQRLQENPERLRKSLESGIFTIAFPNWLFKGVDTKPQVGGIVTAPDNATTQGCTLEFVNEDAQPSWRSGQIDLAPNGAFITTIYAQEGKTNTFQVILRDSMGRQQHIITSPESLTYKSGIVFDHTLLTHSVGVVLINNEVEWFLEKSTPLPARERKILRTVYEIGQGHAGSILRIPVVEGFSSRADRNRRIGKLEVTATNMRRTLPIGSEVEITIVADRSGRVHMTAFIPLLDEEFHEILQLSGPETIPDLTKVSEDFQKQRDRLTELQQMDDTQVQSFLQQIEEEQIIHQIEVEIAVAREDPGSAPAAQNRLLDLTLILDRAEDTAEWPNLVATAEGLIATTKRYFTRFGTLAASDMLRRLEAELQRAIETRDVDSLEHNIKALNLLLTRTLDAAGEMPKMYFNKLVQMRDQMRDQDLARKLIGQGQSALQIGNILLLRDINQRLTMLLPPEQPRPDESTLIRW